MNKKKLLWLDKCKLWKEKWNVIQKKHLNDKNGISIYSVMHFINNFTTNKNVIVGDAGSISYVGPVALEPKKTRGLFLVQPKQIWVGRCQHVLG